VGVERKKSERKMEKGEESWWKESRAGWGHGTVQLNEKRMKKMKRMKKACLSICTVMYVLCNLYHFTTYFHIFIFSSFLVRNPNPKNFGSSHVFELRGRGRIPEGGRDEIKNKYSVLLLHSTN
jgi:hypothetical protein